MVKAKVNSLILTLFVICSCANPAGSGHSYKWNTIPADAHRSGVEPLTSTNSDKALGSVEEGVYKAPNGEDYTQGCTPSLASLLIEVQPQMAYLKEVIAYAPKAMEKARPQSELSNFTVDCIKATVEALTGRKVDLAITNFGGIRCDIPQGDVILDDIVSMFPFNNYLVYVQMEGRRVREIFTEMVSRKVEAVSGVELQIEGKKVLSLKVGGEEIQDDKLYGIGSIDFLLRGGDKIHLADGAKEIIKTDCLIRDCVLEGINALTREGKPLEYHLDNRVQELKTAHGRLSILHVNDTHSHMEPLRDAEYHGYGGIIERGIIVDSVRRSRGEDNVLLLHAGDFNQGSSYYSEFGGELEVKVLNAFRYDCVTIGNHEFDNGVEDLAARLRKIDAPIVCANIKLEDTALEGLVSPYAIVEKAGMKIGVIGLVSDLATNVAYEISSQLHQYDNLTVTNKYARLLKNKYKCDLVILLSHLGFKEDTQLISSTKDVDVVVGGHSHTFLDEICYKENAAGRQIPIVTDGCFGVGIGELTVD